MVVSASAGVAERFPPDLADLLLGNPDDPGQLADRLRGWRRDLDAWPARVAPFSVALRARTWDDMSAEFVKSVETP